jgi:hypothetical protein
MISFCIPTRKRPEVFKAMCLSVLSTVSNPADIEFVIYRDDDDDSVYEYFGNYKEIRGKRIYADPSVNECSKIATGPIYMFTCDDVVFDYKDWDKEVYKAFDLHPDKIMFLYFTDHIIRSRHGAIGCLHKNWIDTVGYLFNPALVRRGDMWINELAKRLHRRVYTNAIGYTNMLVQTDTTHEEYKVEIEKTNNLKQYYSQEMREARERDIRALQGFIDNFKT